MTTKIYTYFIHSENSTIHKLEINKNIITIFYKAALLLHSDGIDSTHISYNMMNALEAKKFTLVGTEQNGYPEHRDLHIDNSDLDPQYGGEFPHAHYKIPGGEGNTVSPEHLNAFLNVATSAKKGRYIGIDTDSAKEILDAYQQDFAAQANCPKKQEQIYRRGRNKHNEKLDFDTCGKQINNRDYPGREQFPYPPSLRGYKEPTLFSANSNKATPLPASNQKNNNNDQSEINVVACGGLMLAMFAVGYLYKKVFSAPTPAHQTATTNNNNHSQQEDRVSSKRGFAKKHR